MQAAGKRTGFIAKLWDILENERNNQAITWCPEGDGIWVVDRAQLKIVLQTYFSHKNFSSFQRQLNYFGFKHKGRCVYMHPQFCRDDQHTALQIVRKVRTYLSGADWTLNFKMVF
jgi:hypothetical protein